MGGYHEYDHTAPVHGTDVVFASVEYPKDEPPEAIEIDGTKYVRERVFEAVTYSRGAVGHTNCGRCNWLIDPYDRYCRRCGTKIKGMRRGDADQQTQPAAAVR